MPCGCTDSKNLLPSRHKLLNIDEMKSSSIDEIVNLYRQGYSLGNSDCTVVSAQFQKNGSTTISGCTATLGDSIGFNASVNFSSGEVDKYYYCWFDVHYPNGATHEFFTSPTPTHITAAGTHNFIMDKFIQKTDPVGTYSIISTYIYESSDLVNPVCSMYPATGACTSLDVAAAPPPSVAGMGAGIMVIGVAAAAILLLAMRKKE